MAATKLIHPLVLAVLLFSLALLGCSGGGDDGGPDPDPNAVRPSITGISTSGAGPGDQITIHGTGFGNTQSGSSVSLNDIDFAIVSWSDTEIVAAVVTGMTSGIVVVKVKGLESQSGAEAQLFVPAAPAGTPMISAILPDYGYAGLTEVLIIGTGFGSAQGSGGVFFTAAGGTTVQAPVVSIDIGGVPTPQWTNASIKVTVPQTAVSGPVFVSANSLDSNSRHFTILPPTTPPGGPAIVAMDPANGAVGTVVTIDGLNFGHAQGSSTIKINGINMEVLSWTNLQIVAKVPPGAASGSIRITVAGQFVESAQFVVANAPEITGISPQVLKIGNPVTLYGNNFGFTQGTGRLQIGSSTVAVSSWNNNTVTVASLPSINFQDIEAIPVTLTADNGLSDATVVSLGTNLSVTVQAAPTAGEAGSTVFSFFVAVNGGSGNYGYSLIPDADAPNSLEPETSTSPVTYTYPLAKVPAPTTFQTRMKVVDKSNGDTTIVDGPEIFVVPAGTPVIISIELADHNNPAAVSPRNPWLYVWEPPTFAKELYHDFTFFGGEITFASGLSEVSDGVNPVSGTTRVERNYLSGGSLARPYGYRYNDGDGRGSIVRLNGINLGDTMSSIYLNSDGPASPKPGTAVPLADIISWTSTAIDFYLPANILADLSGNVVVVVNGENVKSSQKLLCSPWITNVLPDPVDLLGPLTLTGFDLTVPQVSGVTGSETYLFFVVNAEYNDPFGGGTTTGPALLTTPFPVTPAGNTIQISMTDLGGSGPVEVFNAVGDQAQIVNGTFKDGDWQVFVWSGAITTGTNFVKAHSGLMSQSVPFTVGLVPPGP